MTERPDKLNNQAIILASDGNYNDAIACFKRAITIEKDNYLLWYNLGVTYRDSGDLEKARETLQNAHKIAPENEDILEALATICIELTHYSETLELVISGIELNDSNPHFWNLLGVVYFKTEDYNTAAEAFESAVILNPYYLDALYNLHDTYKELNNEFGVQECERKIKLLEKRK